ncbi:MAG: hypothetical protein WC661_08755 [Opitutaceae bacterium]
MAFQKGISLKIGVYSNDKFMEKLIQAIIDRPGEANAVIAFAALVTSLLSFYLTFRGLQLQKKHNFNTVKPIGWISLADYENLLSVKIQNNGVGPMLIKSVSVLSGGQKKGSIIEWMPKGIEWDTFIGVFEDRCLSAGQELTVIQLSGNADDPKFVALRDSCRVALGALTVEVAYRDIYDRKMPLARRPLDWFERNLK